MTQEPRETASKNNTRLNPGVVIKAYSIVCANWQQRPLAATSRGTDTHTGFTTDAADWVNGQDRSLPRANGTDDTLRADGGDTFVLTEPEQFDTCHGPTVLIKQLRPQLSGLTHCLVESSGADVDAFQLRNNWRRDWPGDWLGHRV